MFTVLSFFFAVINFLLENFNVSITREEKEIDLLSKHFEGPRHEVDQLKKRIQGFVNKIKHRNIWLTSSFFLSDLLVALRSLPDDGNGSRWGSIQAFWRRLKPQGDIYKLLSKWRRSPLMAASQTESPTNMIEKYTLSNGFENPFALTYNIKTLNSTGTGFSFINEDRNFKTHRKLEVTCFSEGL